MEEDMKTLVSDEIKKFRLSSEVRWLVSLCVRKVHLSLCVLMKLSIA